MPGKYQTKKSSIPFSRGGKAGKVQNTPCAFEFISHNTIVKKVIQEATRARDPQYAVKGDKDASEP